MHLFLSSVAAGYAQLTAILRAVGGAMSGDRMLSRTLFLH